jgi:hypothetical protein
MARHHHGPGGGGKARFGPAHIAGLFVFYAVLAFCVFAFTFFYVYTGVEFRLVILLTVVIGAIATLVHVKAGRRTRIDSLIDKGP